MYDKRVGFAHRSALAKYVKPFGESAREWY